MCDLFMKCKIKAVNTSFCTQQQSSCSCKNKPLSASHTHNYTYTHPACVCHIRALESPRISRKKFTAHICGNDI